MAGCLRVIERVRPCALIAMFAVAIVTLVSHASGQASENENLYFRVELIGKEQQGLSGLTYAFHKASSLTIRFAGAKSDVKLAEIKSLSRDLQTDRVKIRLANGKEFTVSVESASLRNARLKLKGLMLRASLGWRAIRSLAAVAAPLGLPKLETPTRKALFVKFTEENETSAPLLIGQTDEAQKYSPISYRFLNSSGTTHSSISIEVGKSCTLYLPIHTLENLAVTKEGMASFKLRNGEVFKGKGDNLADGFYKKQFHGVYQGKWFARNASLKWRKAVFEWGPIPPRLPRSRTTPTLPGEWYTVRWEHDERELFVERFADNDGKETKWHGMMSEGALELDVSAALHDTATLTLLPKRKEVEVSINADESTKLKPLAFPRAIIGYFTQEDGTPIRMVCPMEKIVSMKRIEAPAKPNGKMLSSFNALAKELPKLSWDIVDGKGRKWTVTSLAGHHFGEAYQNPPPGYHYIGNRYYVEDALLGGNFIAIPGKNDETLHVPSFLAAQIDARSKRVTFQQPIQGKTDFVVRGFVGIESVGDDIENYLLRGTTRYQWLALTGQLGDGRQLVFPRENVTTITPRQAEQKSPPDPDSRKRPADESGGGEPVHTGRLRIVTAEGELELTKAKLKYPCRERGSYTSKVAAKWLALGKDEDNDDPDEFLVEKILVELEKGPILAFDLKNVISVKKAGNQHQVSLGSETFVGNVTSCEVVGEGPFGQMSLEIGRVKELTVVRKMTLRD